MNKSEKEILAQIRNDFGPILSFFTLWDDVATKTTLTREQKEDVYKMILREEGQVNEVAKKIAKQLKSLG